MRQIVIDTETTGLSPADGHRIVEIGCVEIIDRKITGHKFHLYFNPDRKCDEGAFKVHGLTDDFLSKQFKFEDYFYEIHNFLVGCNQIIIHNAQFDIGFLKKEIINTCHTWNNKDISAENYFHHEIERKVLCTMQLAKDKGHQKTNLNALCEYYQIDISHRNFHGALIDAELTAHIYLKLAK